MRAELVAGALCVAVACSGGDAQPDAASDVGVDATSADDVGFDSPRVDAPVDAAFDAPLAPDDPGWTRLPGFPDECFIERARQPEAVLSFHWEPCRDGLPRCEMAVLDRSVGALRDVAGAHSGNDAHDALIWTLDRSDRPGTIVAVTRAASVAAAWRVGPFDAHFFCGAATAPGPDGMGLEVSSGSGTRSSADAVAVGAWDDLGGLDAPVWNVSSDVVHSGDFLEAASASGTTFAAMTTTGHIVVVEPPLGAVIGDGTEPVVVGHTVLWNWGDAAGATAIHASSLEGSETELYRAPAGSHAYGVRADGEWIAWRGGVDDPTGASFPLNELWAAPYSATGPLDAHRLGTDLTGGGLNGTIGDGMFAYTGADDTGMHQAVFVVDLAAGTRRTYVLPTDLGAFGWVFNGDPAWVTRTEVVLPATGGGATDGFRTAVRIDLAALTPTVLP